MAHHSNYQRLTSDPNDAIGLFAYIVEKKTGIGGPVASDNQTTIERAKPTGPATTPDSNNP